MPFDRFNTVVAYAYVAERYHSGQSSKGYAILSRIYGRMRFHLGGMDWASLLNEPDVRQHIACLLWRRRREIQRTW